MTKQEFPHENWYIEITDDNRKIVNDWKIKQKYSNNLFDNLHYKYVNWNGAAVREGGGWLVLVGDFEITTEQFIEYILKQPLEEPSYSYLTPLLKKLNVK